MYDFIENTVCLNYLINSFQYLAYNIVKGICLLYAYFIDQTPGIKITQLYYYCKWYDNENYNLKTNQLRSHPSDSNVCHF